MFFQGSLTKLYRCGKDGARFQSYFWPRRSVVTVLTYGEVPMLPRILSGAVLAGLLLSVSAPASFAADAPLTKEQCAKHKKMHWDDATSKCVKN